MHFIRKINHIIRSQQPTLVLNTRTILINKLLTIFIEMMILELVIISFFYFLNLN
jgi:hypothetical protein